MGSCASKPTATTAPQTKAPVRHLSWKAPRLWKVPSTSESLYTVDDRVPTPTEFPDTATATFDSEYESLCATSCAPQELRRHSLSDWTPPSSPASSGSLEPSSDSLDPCSHTRPFGDSTLESLDYAIEEAAAHSNNDSSANDTQPQPVHKHGPTRDVASPENA